METAHQYTLEESIAIAEGHKLLDVREVRARFAKCRTTINRIKDLRLHIEQLRSAAGMSSGMGGGGSGPKHDLSDVAVSIVRHEEIICAQIKRLDEQYTECSRIVDEISQDNPLAGEVLSMRYLRGASWGAIRRRIGCSDRTIFRLHRQGLYLASQKVWQ